MGDANASIPTPQPVFGRPCSPGCGRRRGAARWRSFLLAVDGLADLGLESRVVAVADTRSRRGRPTCRRTTPARTSASSPDTFRVWVDGEEIVPDPPSRASPRPAILPLLMAPLPLAAGRLPLPGRAATRTRSGSSRRCHGLADVPGVLAARLRRRGGRRALRRRGRGAGSWLLDASGARAARARRCVTPPAARRPAAARGAAVRSGGTIAPLPASAARRGRSRSASSRRRRACRTRTRRCWRSTRTRRRWPPRR